MAACPNPKFVPMHLGDYSGREHGTCPCPRRNPHRTCKWWGICWRLRSRGGEGRGEGRRMHLIVSHLPSVGGGRFTAVSPHVFHESTGHPKNSVFFLKSHFLFCQNIKSHFLLFGKNDKKHT